jgi:uncharacterized protein YbcI
MVGHVADPRTTERARPRSPAQTISNAMVGLIRRNTGRGPTHARTALNSNFVLVSFHGMLTRAEQHLVDGGRADVVIETRRTLHEVMREEAVELVEGTLDRHVESLLSDIDPAAGVAVMVFMLDRVIDHVEVAEVNGD